jgi:hypothetical protein
MPQALHQAARTLTGEAERVVTAARAPVLMIGHFLSGTLVHGARQRGRQAVPAGRGGDTSCPSLRAIGTSLSRRLRARPTALKRPHRRGGLHAEGSPQRPPDVVAWTAGGLILNREFTELDLFCQWP